MQRISAEQIKSIKRAKYCPINDEMVRRLVIRAPMPFLPISFEEVDVKERDPELAPYTVNMFGVLPNGSRAVINVRGLPVYFYVALSDDIEEARKQEIVVAETITQDMICQTIPYKAYPFETFSKEMRNYLKVVTGSIASRRKLMDDLEKKGMRLYHNDPAYLPVLLRDRGWKASSWMCVSGYKYNKGSVSQYDLTAEGTTYDNWLGTDHVFSIVYSAGNDGRVTNRDAIVHFDTLEEIGWPSNDNEWFNKEPIMHCTWDIETFKELDDGEIPMDGQDYKIFNICASFQWQHSKMPFMTMSLVIHESAVSKKDDEGLIGPESYLVVLENAAHKGKPYKERSLMAESALLRAWANILSTMRPDIITAFNGSGFDWPRVMDRATVHGNLMDQYMRAFKYTPNVFWGMKYCDSARKKDRLMRKEYFKVSADDQIRGDIFNVVAPGFISTDAMLIFKRIFSNEQLGIRGCSLNLFLKLCKLTSKYDMSYKRMKHIYGLADLYEDLTSEHIKAYERDWQLEPNFWPAPDMTPREKVAHEMGEVVKYCLIDAYKCHELYLARAVINDAREISNMAFMPLYDSFWRANGSKVRNVIAHECAKLNYLYHFEKRDPIESLKYPGAYVFTPQKGLNRKRPVTALDFSSLYPSLFMTYNLSPEKIVHTEEMAQKFITIGYKLHSVDFKCNNAYQVKGCIVAHENNECVHSEAPLPGQAMGIMPAILKRLFALRAQMKVILGDLKLILEKNSAGQEISSELLQRVGATKVDINAFEALCSKVNAKQAAAKVFMNTFYGEAGSARSPIFDLLVSGSCTYFGRAVIQKVAAKLQNGHGCSIIYGDTDSAYLECPDFIYHELDKQYESCLAKLK